MSLQPCYIYISPLILPFLFLFGLVDHTVLYFLFITRGASATAIPFLYLLFDSLSFSVSDQKKITNDITLAKSRARSRYNINPRDCHTFWKTFSTCFDLDGIGIIIFSSMIFSRKTRIAIALALLPRVLAHTWVRILK
jgi:hypothetical protein